MWEITECPNGLPAITFVVSTPEDVARFLRLPWHFGYYLIHRI